MGLHFGICHGPVDYMSEIRVGGRTAYNITVTSSTEIYIDEPKLFGGKSREGGIQGYGDILNGESTQGVNAYLQEKIGAEARVPAFRGLYAFVYKGGRVSANNPYIKPWAFKVGRIRAGWGELVEEAVTETTTDYLPDWIEGTGDPRDLEFLFDYKYGITEYDNLSDAEDAAETDAGYSLSRLPLWRILGGEPSPLEEIDPGEREWLSLQYVDSVAFALLPEGAYYSAADFNEAVSLTSPPGDYYDPFTGLYNLGIPVNSYAYVNLYGGGIFYTQYGSPPDAPTTPINGWHAYNNCVGDFGCPYNPVLGYVASGLRTGVYDVDVRRLPSPPPLPGSDLPDWPDDPANFWWDPDTGQTYSKAPWSLTAGSYRWLSTYSVSSGIVVRKPFGPVLEQGDASDTEAYWTAAYEAAVTAGTLPEGMTYDPTGAGGITTYPRNSAYAYTRTYTTLVPAEPPDPEYVQLGGDMNPAHIVRQCITNDQWGMGYPDALIGSSFTTCAQQLFDEEFGLSFQWTQQEPIEDFIGQVLNHCGGVWYADPRTGMFEMALIRDDYSISDLREFNESNILAVESYQRPGYGELVNEITVTWTDVENNRTATTAPLQDLACIAAQGSVISEVRQYPGITKAHLAQRVALRDLTAASTPLASIKLKVNREGWDLIPGKDCIVLNWDKLGIVQLVCRVLKVDRGSLEDGAITLEVAEDVFGLPDAVYTTQESEEWTDPNVEPDDIIMQDLVESPYWDIARNLSAADLDYTDIDAGYVFTLAGRNSGTETSYGIWSRTGSDEYEEQGDGPFAATALLNGAIDQAATTINFDNGVDLDLVAVGDRVQIGSGRLAEFCEVLTFGASSMTVSRAVLDTTPQSHADNTRIWFVENSFGVDQTERATSDEVDVKLTAISTGGESDLEDATEQTITLAGRFGRPYPPGRIRINGESFPTLVDTTEAESEGFVIEWAHRDREQQTADLVSQDAGNIGPEAGTTYTVELYNDTTDTLVDSVSGITGTNLSLTVTDSFQARLEVYSMRDGIESWQRQFRRFTLLGTSAFITEDGDYFVTEDGQILAPE
jgi:hypothetical protein